MPADSLWLTPVQRQTELEVPMGRSHDESPLMAKSVSHETSTLSFETGDVTQWQGA